MAGGYTRELDDQLVDADTAEFSEAIVGGGGSLGRQCVRPGDQLRIAEQRVPIDDPERLVAVSSLHRGADLREVRHERRGWSTYTPSWSWWPGSPAATGPRSRLDLSELRDLGVAVPDSVPSFYPVPTRLLTQDDVVQVAHGDTSGEAEVMLFVNGPGCHVTLVSDHTDRLVETTQHRPLQVGLPKVVASNAWRLDEVAAHFDALVLRSWIESAGATELYQEGTVAGLITPTDLLDMVPFRTLPRLGRPARRHHPRHRGDPGGGGVPGRAHRSGAAEDDRASLLRRGHRPLT